MRTIVHWLFLFTFCGYLLLYVSTLTKDEEDSLLWKLSRQYELKRQLAVKIQNIKQEISHLAEKIYGCEKKLEVSGCVTANENNKLDGQDVSNDNDEVNRLASTANKAASCDCEECEVRIEELKKNKTHHVDLFHTCKLKRQSHLTLQFLLTRELKSLTTKLEQLEDELTDRKFVVKKIAKELAKLKKDLSRLKKDHRQLDEDDKLLSRDVKKLRDNLDLCKMEKEHSDFLRQGSELALDDQKKRIVKLKEEIRVAEEENNVAKKDSRVYSIYLLTSVFALLAWIGTKLYTCCAHRWAKYTEVEKAKPSKKTKIH